MRTVAVRFSTAEHRVLYGLAAAQDASVETLTGEALGLASVDLRSPAVRRLEVIRGSGAAPGTGSAKSDAVPIG